MELADPRPAMDRDYFGRIGIEIVGQRVELLLPMRDAVPRVQPMDLGSPVLTGRKPMAGEHSGSRSARLPGMASSASAIR